MSWQPPGPALLFCPADRPDRFAKAAASADGVILDLEDGVAPADRPAARLAIQETLIDPATTIVRINPSGTEDHHRDREALSATPYDLVMLAKTEAPDQVRALSPLQVIALVETPRGVLAAEAIAAGGVVALMWGAEDLIAALGGRSSRRGDGHFRDVAQHARAAVLLAASAHGKGAIDSVHLDICDRGGLAAQAEEAVGSGFAAVACIHPSQVDVVRTAFRPTAGEIEAARRLLAAAADAAGVFAFEGRMIDAPVLRHAQRLLDQAR
jgi:citrate lyase subunit beta / citryl-CoA lyase